MALDSAHLFNRTRARNHQQSHWLARLLAAIAGVRSVIRAELGARRAAAELANLDDRMLRDIGISRGDIPSLVRRPLASPQAADLDWRQHSDRRAGC